MSGAKLREYHFLRALSQNSRLTYLYFAESEQTETMREHLAFCERIVAVAKPETYSSWNLIRGATGRWPVPVLNYTSAAMASALSQLQASYDLVHLDSIHMT